jgi:hypothetical protein
MRRSESFRSGRIGQRENNRTPIGQINATLQGPVTEILMVNIPAFANRTRDQVYELVMNSPEIGDACFKLFRSKPELFAEVLKGPDGTPVANDGGLLSCGRTVAQVIALIVKNMTRRYFRNKLDGGSPAAKRTPPSWTERLLELAGLPATRRPQPRSTTQSAGDRLYRAIRDYLVYEWQVRLIPKYSTLTVSFVTANGPQLLTLREPEEIDALMTAKEVKDKPKSSGIVGDFVPNFIFPPDGKRP